MANKLAIGMRVMRSAVGFPKDRVVPKRLGTVITDADERRMYRVRWDDDAPEDRAYPYFASELVHVR